ncbi:MAG TPA: YwiC-like family protein [Acidobacteriota bacterium]|nr:YwiC-like family protein [Acidobacteriota bacterium]
MSRSKHVGEGHPNESPARGQAHRPTENGCALEAAKNVLFSCIDSSSSAVRIHEAGSERVVQASRARISRRRIPIPREHGAWAVFYGSALIPLLAACSLGLKEVLFLSAASGFFLAHQPLSRLLRVRKGTPGAGHAAWWRLWLLIYLAVGLACGLALLTRYGLWELCLIGGLAALFFGLHLLQVRGKKERQVAGEVIGIVGLTATAPAAQVVAQSRLDESAALIWSLCFLYFASSIFYVKMRVSRFVKKEDPRRRTLHNILYHAGLVVVVGALWTGGLIGRLIALAYLPIVSRAFWYLREPSARLNLQVIGYSEIAFTLWFVIFTTVGWAS